MDDNIFKWDHFSDQPYPITDQKYKRKKKILYIYDHLKVFVTSIFVLPFAALVMRFFKPNKITSYGIGVNVDKGDSQFELVKELGVKNLLIRMPLWEVHNINEYLSFVKKFKEQDRSISIVLNILQDRDNIENHSSLSENIRVIFKSFSPYVNEFQVGNAINRSKWGFFGIDEYLRFYKVIQRIRDTEFKSLKLIGPSVIDFEYSKSIRSLFNLYKVKYNAISSLLYVDRRGSPYNRQLFFFDTKNKVKLLYAISKLSRKSSDDIYISEVNWPLLAKGNYSPIGYEYKVSSLKAFYKHRVKPLLGASEETRVSEEVYAKYMLDYHEIVKSTKAVKRLYWHQLIAPGYGLVDDSGDTLRKMPAFYVYKKFIKDNS